ncbi:hypothetical protein [Pedobacter jeongneungensis]|uniref:hypothetical protein n=1 Tax=Pedobacter jeongneungensis TaxID=947309 RepID=UPI000468F88A|nr:hypothetical protein [Pedobacter jeongneungensis]
MKNNINPALQELKQFIGTWEMEISNASFLPDASAVIKASASFEWFEEGEFLIFRQGTKNKETPWAIWFIGHDKDLLFDPRRQQGISLPSKAVSNTNRKHI